MNSEHTSYGHMSYMYEDASRHKKKLIATLALSLLFHCCILLFLTVIERHAPLKEQFIPFEDIPMSEMPASLKPGMSPFAVEMVVDSPAVEEQQPHTLGDNDTSTPAETPRDIPEVADAIPMQQVAEQTLTPKQAADQALFPDTNIVPAEEALDSPEPSKEEDKEASIDLKTLALQNLLKKQFREMLKTQRPAGGMNGGEASNAQQAQPPMPDILAHTRNLLESIKNEGTDSLERKGDDSKRPSFEEMMYISYMEKIFFNLQKAFKIKISNDFYTPHRGTCILYFTITNQGNLANLDLINEAPQQRLTDMTIKHLKYAAPFPPIPKHLKINELSFIYSVQYKPVGQRMMIEQSLRRQK